MANLIELSFPSWKMLRYWKRKITAEKPALKDATTKKTSRVTKASLVLERPPTARARERQKRKERVAMRDCDMETTTTALREEVEEKDASGRG